MKPLAKFLVASYSVKAWKDGDSFAFIWRWYHPFTWFFVPVLIVLSVLLNGLPDTIKDSDTIGLGLSKYWKENRNKRQFI